MSQTGLEEPFRLGNIPDGLASGEAKILAQMIIAVDRRCEQTHEDLPEMISSAVAKHLEERALSPEQRQFLLMLIKREERRDALRKAVIEKTVTGLMWSLVVAAGVILREWFQSHMGKTP